MRKLLLAIALIAAAVPGMGSATGTTAVYANATVGTTGYQTARFSLDATTGRHDGGSVQGGSGTWSITADDGAPIAGVVRSIDTWKDHQDIWHVTVEAVDAAGCHCAMELSTPASVTVERASGLTCPAERWTQTGWWNSVTVYRSALWRISGTGTIEDATGPLTMTMWADVWSNPPHPNALGSGAGSARLVRAGAPDVVLTLVCMELRTDFYFLGYDALFHSLAVEDNGIVYSIVLDNYRYPNGQYGSDMLSVRAEPNLQARDLLACPYKYPATLRPTTGPGWTVVEL